MKPLVKVKLMIICRISLRDVDRSIIGRNEKAAKIKSGSELAVQNRAKAVRSWLALGWCNSLLSFPLVVCLCLCVHQAAPRPTPHHATTPALHFTHDLTAIFTTTHRRLLSHQVVWHRGQTHKTAFLLSAPAWFSNFPHQPPFSPPFPCGLQFRHHEHRR